MSLDDQYTREDLPPYEVPKNVVTPPPEPEEPVEAVPVVSAIPSEITFESGGSSETMGAPPTTPLTEKKTEEKVEGAGAKPQTQAEGVAPPWNGKPPGFTNQREVYIKDPNNWVYIPDMDKPGTDLSSYFKTDPRLQKSYPRKEERTGVVEGELSYNALKIAFPELFPTRQFLDPVEQVKKEKGLPYDKDRMVVSDPSWTPDSGRPVEVVVDAPARPSREQVRNLIFRKLGGNPFASDPNEMAAGLEQNLPQLFEDMFRGQLTWKYRGYMTKEQSAQWNKVKNQYLAQGYQRAKEDRQRKIEQYKFMMDEYEKEEAKASKETARRQKEAAAEQVRRYGGKAPHTINALDDDSNSPTFGDKVTYIWNSDLNGGHGWWEKTTMVAEPGNMWKRAPQSIKDDVKLIEMVVGKMKTDAITAALLGGKDNPQITDDMLGGAATMFGPKTDQLVKEAKNRVAAWIEQNKQRQLKEEEAKRAPSAQKSQAATNDLVARIMTDFQRGVPAEVNLRRLFAPGGILGNLSTDQKKNLLNEVNKGLRLLGVPPVSMTFEAPRAPSAPKKQEKPK